MRPGLVAIAALLATCATAQNAAAAWKEDLAFLAKELPAKHKNAFAVLPKEQFEKRVADLGKRIAALDDLHAEGELVSLVAAIGDSHSNLEMRALSEGPRLPLGLYWFADGLRVVAVPKQHQKASGALVKKIGKCDLDELAKRLGRMQHFDNQSMRRSTLPNLVTLPKLLEYLDVVDDGSKVEVTVVDDKKKEMTIDVRPGPMGKDAVVLRPPTPPLTAPRGQKWHDSELLEKEGILYVQYNKCSTDEDHDLDKFTEGLVTQCATGKVKALVIDVQYNGGGISPLGDEMFKKLAAEAPMKDRKNVFCVIGRRTFSSAILNAMRLKKAYGATLVGEPTGGARTTSARSRASSCRVRSSSAGTHRSGSRTRRPERRRSSPISASRPRSRTTLPAVTSSWTRSEN